MGWPTKSMAAMLIRQGYATAPPGLARRVAKYGDIMP